MADFNFIPRWLPIKSAAFYSAIGKDRLKELAESGKIVGFKDPTDKRGNSRMTLNSTMIPQKGVRLMEV